MNWIFDDNDEHGLSLKCPVCKQITFILHDRRYKTEQPDMCPNCKQKLDPYEFKNKGYEDTKLKKVSELSVGDYLTIDGVRRKINNIATDENKTIIVFEQEDWR